MCSSGVSGAVEDDIEPVVALQPFGRAVFVLGQRDDADAGPALDLDEADLDEGLGVFGMRHGGRSDRNHDSQRLDALDHPAAGFFVPAATSMAMRSISSSRTMGAMLWAGSLGMGQDPGPAEMRDVGNRRSGVPAPARPGGFRGGCSDRRGAVSAWVIRPSRPATVWPATWRLRKSPKLELLAVDQGVQADFDVPADALDFVDPVGGDLFAPRLERLLVQELFDRAGGWARLRLSAGAGGAERERGRYRAERSARGATSRRPGSVSTANSRRCRVRARPSLIEAANTSSRPGWLRCRSKKTAP